MVSHESRAAFDAAAVALRGVYAVTQCRYYGSHFTLGCRCVVFCGSGPDELAGPTVVGGVVVCV